MENKCPKYKKDNYNYGNGDIEQDGDTLWIDYWCSCCSCGHSWRYIERFTLDTAWFETEEKD